MRRDYVEAAVDRFDLDAESLVVELASNDGYLLQHVVERGIPALGVEPAANVAARGTGEGDRDGRRVLRPGARVPPRGGRPPSRPAGRQQRFRARPGPERLRRRHGNGARAPRRDHDRVPAPGAADRRKSVRHHLPRALLLLLLPHRSEGPRGARARGLRRRRAAHPRRFAARLRAKAVRRHPPSQPVGAGNGGP